MDTTLKQNRIDTRASAQTSTTEWRFVTFVIFATLAITSLPYVYAYLSVPPDKTFMGFVLNTPDHTQYFSWFREFTTANLSANKLTPEANQPVFFNLMWWMLAKLSAFAGLSYHAIYQLIRVVGSSLFLIAAYRMCVWTFDDLLQRRTAFLIAALGAGLGWVLVVMKYTVTRGELLNPLDLYVAEGNTLLCMMGYPHFLAAATYIFVFDIFLKAHATRQYRYAIYAGLLALFLGWQHAYDLFIIWFVIAAFVGLLWLRDRKLPKFEIISLILIGVLSCSPGFYSFLLTRLDPVWKGVLAQFDNAGVFTPPLWRLPVMLGFSFVLAVFFVAADWLKTKSLTQSAFDVENKAQTSSVNLFVKGWFLISFVLIYMPTDYQIHMLNGWQVPIAILATQALFGYIVPFLAKRWQTISRATLNLAAATAIVLAVIPTNVYLWAWRFTELRKHAYPYFLYNDEMAAFKWIEQNANPNDAVLSSLNVGSFLPMFTGAHAYLSHWAQTLDFFEKEKNVAKFFSSTASDAEREKILRDHNVDYVIYGPSEKMLGENSPDTLPFVKLVYETDKVKVFRVE
jgi:hypothetical protein